MDKELSEERPERAEDMTEEVASEPEATSSSFDPSRFVTHDDLEAFAHQIAAMIQSQARPRYEQKADDEDVPDPLADPGGFARYLREQSRHDRHETIREVAEAIQRQQMEADARLRAMEQLGGDAAAEYVDGLSTQDLAFIARHPGLSKLFRDRGGLSGRGGRTAPRSEGSYQPDGEPLTPGQQREFDRAASMWGDSDWFDPKEFQRIQREKGAKRG